LCKLALERGIKEHQAKNPPILPKFSIFLRSFAVVRSSYNIIIKVCRTLSESNKTQPPSLEYVIPQHLELDFRSDTRAPQNSKEQILCPTTNREAKETIIPVKEVISFAYDHKPTSHLSFTLC
jgi:hypothetical protein